MRKRKRRMKNTKTIIKKQEPRILTRLFYSFDFFSAVSYHKIMNIPIPKNNEFNKEIEEVLKAIHPIRSDISDGIHPETTATPAAAQVSFAAKKSVLVVEDDATLRSIYTAVFRENGFNAISANDGQDAWEKMESGIAPDAVFTGITMPRMGGFALFEKMKAHPNRATIPVVFFSHRGVLEDKKRAEELGAADFINKLDATPADVVRRFRSIFGEHEKIRTKLSSSNREHKALIELLKRQQMTSCLPDMNGEYTLEIETASGRGIFSLKIIC